MSFREVGVHEIREVLRLWLRGHGFRSIARRSSVDRKTVRRYVEAAGSCGLVRDAGEEQLDDVLIVLMRRWLIAGTAVIGLTASPLASIAGADSAVEANYGLCNRYYGRIVTPPGMSGVGPLVVIEDDQSI